MARVYRLGQTQPVVTVRFFMKNSIEEVRPLMYTSPSCCINLTSFQSVCQRSSTGKEGVDRHGILNRSD